MGIVPEPRRWATLSATSHAAMDVPMPQKYPSESLVKFPDDDGTLQVGIVLSYTARTDEYEVACLHGSISKFSGEQLEERVSLAGERVPSAPEDNWNEYLPQVPARDLNVVDPGFIYPKNEENTVRQRHSQAMLRVERKAAKELKEQIKKVELNQTPPNHHLGCIRAGMRQAREESNPILRWISFVMAYACAFSRSFTDTFTLWVAKHQYWATEIHRAVAGAKMSKPPLLFIIFSKCSADLYCANMDDGGAHPHRSTLNVIRAQLESMFPGHHIILIDIPATLLGCKRAVSQRGYKPCKKTSVAGLTILFHIAKMMIAAAHACGIQLLGVSSISASVTLAQIDSWLDCDEPDLGTQVPELLFSTIANYPRQRLGWVSTMDTIRGLGLHYVFMHLPSPPGPICIRVTAWSLGVRGDTEAGIIGEVDIMQLRLLGFMMHTLAGKRLRDEYVLAEWDNIRRGEYDPVVPPNDYHFANAKNDIVFFDFPDPDDTPPSDPDDTTPSDETAAEDEVELEDESDDDVGSADEDEWADEDESSESSKSSESEDDA